MKFLSDEQVELVLKKLEKGKLEQIKNIELDGDSIRYSFILEYIKVLGLDSRDNLQINTLLYMETNEGDINDILVHILNHILLEIPRAKEMESLRNESKNTKETNNNIRSEIQNYVMAVKECEERVSKSQSEFISILSIFAAVIIAFLGGMSLIGSALNNMDNVSKYRLIFVLLTIGFIMFNVIYMLLYIVSKLVHGKIYMKKQECEECDKRKISNCLINRHPLLFYYNYFSSILIFLVFLLYNIDKYNIFSAIANLINIDNSLVLIPIEGIIFLGCVLLIIYKVSKRIISKKDCSKEDAS
ncbi:hypothetical protein Q3304_17625 [Clostridioides sp. GD02377]|uniref:hypothetical protein n=1 Tax=unclassified Clostridioides TaxID=2635829 RepID=UPI0038A7571E